VVPENKRLTRLFSGECTASAETYPRQSGCGLGRQTFHANPHRSYFVGRNQTSNSLISFPDNIFGERQRYACPSQTLFFGSISRFTKLDDMKKLIQAILPR